ncbi:hypothetical protein ACFWWA_23845 [Streptomyces goshikiensis]|uniref:hypothetical protein n=1 Tax=Streptomyces goshikiensis TaxID=1942 RepID=UPI0036551C93
MSGEQLPKGGQRRTRPWGALRGGTAEANGLAQLLREWLDETDKRVDDVLAELKPEHFTSGKVPSRTTVSDRLAGIGLKIDFVEAIADICSNDAAGRDRLLGQVRALQKRAGAGDLGNPGPDSQGHSHQDANPALTAELVAVQKRSLEVSDKLMRALERAQELERERNSANHMVLLLLTMVDKLQRDITSLARERDRLRGSPAPGHHSLDQVRARLVKSEEQRTTAESELERARAERHKADRLAEDAAEQVRVLTEELDRLRARIADTDADTESSPLSTPPSTLQEALDNDAADIDQALAKAARHLDASAGRLDCLADEIQLDNSPDNRAASQEEADNSVVRSLPRRTPLSRAEPDNSVWASPDEVLSIVRVLSLDNGKTLSDARETLTSAALSQPCGEMLETVALLRAAGYDVDADHLLAYAGERRPCEDVPMLIDVLRADDRSTDAYQILTAVGQKRHPRQVVEIVSLLRLAQHDADAYQVLAAVGRVRAENDVIQVIDAVAEEDRNWVLESARRDRRLKDMLPLVRALERADRKSEAKTVLAALAERAENPGLLFAADDRKSEPTLAWSIHRDDDDEEDFHFRVYRTPSNRHTLDEKTETHKGPAVVHEEGKPSGPSQSGKLVHEPQADDETGTDAVEGES